MQTQNIIGQMSILRWDVVYNITNATGRTSSQAERSIGIAIYIIVIFLLRNIHRNLVKKQKRIHTDLILLYDTIRYQLAKAQYSNISIQGIPGITNAMTAEHKNYIANAQAIKTEIVDIEQKSGQQIVSADQRSKIERASKRKNSLTSTVQTIGRTLTVLTIGVYKLFR